MQYCISIILVTRPFVKVAWWCSLVTIFISRLVIYNDNGCGRTRRVNWVYFSETWLKILNNLAWLKVGYNKITGLHFMSGRTEMGYEVG